MSHFFSNLKKHLEITNFWKSTNQGQILNRPNLCVYQPLYLFSCLYVISLCQYPSLYPSFYLSVCVQLSACLLVCCFACLSGSISVCWSEYLSVFEICPYIRDKWPEKPSYNNNRVSEWLILYIGSVMLKFWYKLNFAQNG